MSGSIPISQLPAEIAEQVKKMSHWWKLERYIDLAINQGQLHVPDFEIDKGSEKKVKEECEKRGFYCFVFYIRGFPHARIGRKQTVDAAIAERKMLEEN